MPGYPKPVIAPELTGKYSDFLINEMMIHSPELQQIKTAGEMIDRKKTMHLRQMYLPVVAFIGSADQAFVREGIIRNPQLPVPSPPDDITWNLGLRVSIPIFEGGRNKNEIVITAGLSFLYDGRKVKLLDDETK